MLVFTGLAAVGAVGLDLAVVMTGGAASLEDVTGTATVLGCIGVLLSLMGTCRVVGVSDGHIEVVGLFLTKRIPVGAIAGVTAGRGLEIVLHDGRRIDSTAHGASLIGDLVHYPRSVRTAQRIGQFLASLPPSAWPVSVGVTTVVRGRELLGGVVFVGLLVLVSVVISEA